MKLSTIKYPSAVVFTLFEVVEVELVDSVEIFGFIT